MPSASSQLLRDDMPTIWPVVQVCSDVCHYLMSLWPVAWLHRAAGAVRTSEVSFNSLTTLILEYFVSL